MPRPVSCLSTFLPLLICLSCSTRPSPVPETSSGSNAGGEKQVYTDGIGRRVTLPRHPMRIVSLAPSVTEVIYMVGADERLIGVTTHCDWPESVRTKPKLGDLINPNYELLLAAKPDLVIASTAGNDRTAVLKIADLSLPVFVTAPRSVDKIFETVAQIGRITDCSAQGDALVSRMKARLEEIERRLAGLTPLHAFFITWFDPLLAPGKETFENDVLRLAGVESITADIDQYYPRYSLEQVLARDPDVIITVRHEDAPLPDLARLAGWQKLRAVRGKRIYILNEVFQHPSPRFVDGIEELARKLYPERFQ